MVKMLLALLKLSVLSFALVGIQITLDYYLGVRITGDLIAVTLSVCFRFLTGVIIASFFWAYFGEKRYTPRNLVNSKAGRKEKEL